MIIPSGKIVRIALGTGLILLIPLAVMRFTDELIWDLSDFAVGGALLFSSGLAYELVAQRLSTTSHRVAVAIAIGIALLLIWAEIAVGILETLLVGH